MLYLNGLGKNNVNNRSYAIILDEPFRYIQLLIVGKSTRKGNRFSYFKKKKEWLYENVCAMYMYII